METANVKYFVTKRLWTHGIEEIRGTITTNGKRFVPQLEAWNDGEKRPARAAPALTIGTDAFETREAAIKRAEWIRTSFVEKMRRKIRTAEALVF